MGSVYDKVVVIIIRKKSQESSYCVFFHSVVSTITERRGTGRRKLGRKEMAAKSWVLMGQHFIYLFEKKGTKFF